MHLVVASGQEVEFKDVDHPRSEDDRQPFVVGDVLHHLSCVMRNKISRGIIKLKKQTAPMNLLLSRKIRSSDQCGFRDPN